MKRNPVRMAALLCVAFTSAFIMYMAWEVNATLSGPGWCRTALGAEKVSGTDGTIKGLDACVGLLTIQLRSLATNSHILFGVVALCLLVLIVIVIAGAKLELQASDTGVKVNMSSATDAAAAAQAATDAGTQAAQAKTDEIKDTAP
jgi:hypothetical protein